MDYTTYRQAMIAYRTSMSITKEMLNKGIITSEDYAKIDRIIAERHGLDLSTIWGRNVLIYPENRGNMLLQRG